MKKTNQDKGITLIALIITIVVLLILAMVTIRAITGDELLLFANKASKEYNIEALKEDATLILQARMIERNTNGINTSSLKDDLSKIKNVDSVENVNERTDMYYVTRGENTITVSEDGTIELSRVDLWDGTSSEPPEFKDFNWYIYNTEQFKFFADFVNNANALTNEQKTMLTEDGYTEETIQGIKIDKTTTVYLMSDLDLGGESWARIGKDTSTMYFKGTFEGNNHFIKGVDIKSTENYVGLFNYSSKEIRNLTIKDSYIETTGEFAGGIVGLGINLINCHNINTTVKQTSARAVGGVAGLINGNIDNCTNRGEVSGISYVGGVVGTLNTSRKATACENYGKVIGNKRDVGGVVGGLGPSAEVYNCTNYGEIIGVQATGGVVGYIYENAKVVDSTNKGSIIGDGKYTGGITGFLCGSITNSINFGNITGKAEYTGGIVGVTPSGNYQVNNSTNEGSVTGTTYVGGISGALSSNGIIDSCKNTGTAIGTNEVGGISGYSKGTISNCINSGIVQGIENIGGISGVLFGKIDRCYNIGTIKQTAEASESESIGGIAGNIGMNSVSTIQNCYNRGEIIIEIDNTNAIGGIVGWISVTGTTGSIVSNNYNIGQITINAESVIEVGGIAGRIGNGNKVELTNNYCIEGTVTIS